MPRLSEKDRDKIMSTTRSKLLEAAAEGFAAEGYAGANINTISTSAGFAKGTIYNYFASKHALLLVLILLLALVVAPAVATAAPADRIVDHFGLEALEIIDKRTIAAVEASVYAAGLPTDAGAVLIIELDGPGCVLPPQIERVRGIAEREGASRLDVARDEAERQQFIAALLSAVEAEEGRTVLFSSHLLDEVELASERVVMLHAGRVVLERGFRFRLARLGTVTVDALRVGLATGAGVGDSEIGLLELFSKSEVVAITLNHEDMTPDEVADLLARLRRQAGQGQPSSSGRGSRSYFRLRRRKGPASVKAMALRPLRVGITQSNRSMPNPMAVPCTS